MKKNNKITILFLIILFLLVLVLLISMLINMLSPKEEINTQESLNNIQKYDEVLNLKYNDLSNILKNYYYANNLIDENNLLIWNIENIKYLGFENNLKYFEISGYYICKNSKSDCVYQEQISDPVNGKYPYIVYVELINDRTIKSITGVLTNKDISKKDEEVQQENLPETNKYIEALKEYYLTNNLVKLDNLTTWHITKISEIYYNTELEYFLLEGFYQCKDNTSNCVYQEQVPEQNKDNTFYYGVYISVLENDSKIIIDKIFGTLPEVEEKKNSLNSNQITDLLKNLYKNSKLVNESNLDYWTTKQITLYGYNEDTYIYYYEGVYKCLDNSSECLYTEQVGDSNSKNEYNFNVFIEIENNEKIKQLHGSYISGELTIINRVIN